MKKLFGLLLMAILLTSCATNASDKPNLIGVIKEVNEDSILLQQEGGLEVIVDRDHLKVVEVGQKVKVVYDGIMTKSLPAKLGKIESVNVIE